MIQVEALKKYYGQTRGIESVTMHVEKGEIFGFVGPNGSGKTTLIRILLGLISKDQGKVQIFNKDVFVGQYEVNNDIGYMPSESFFFQELKVYQIIDYFKNIHQVDEAYLKKIIQLLDIDDQKKFKNLSFGNKKKIGIVVALMHQPKLLILDEPTSGLDPLIQSRFLELLEEQKQKGATILLSSHVLSEIEKVCDRVGLIKNGEILFIKTMEEIRNDEYKRVVIEPQLEDLSCPGLSLISHNQHKSFYAYHGDINNLIKYLSTLSLKDVQIKDVTLEEIFSIYYEKEEVPS